MGGHAGHAFVPMDSAALKRCIIPHTMTSARDLGAAVLRARQEQADPIDAAPGVGGGGHIFAGKIVDVERRMAAGFARGAARLAGRGSWRATTLTIDFQNENLIARRRDGHGERRDRRRRPRPDLHRR